ncbi:FAD-dependent oxidoreductase [Streptomyces chiangmaiensis]
MSDGAALRRVAVVIGGGMTGMLTASVLAKHADVTVIERDLLPDGPQPRKGLPQARHAHVLWSGGVKALDDLLPGVIDRLVARGAWRARIMTDLVSKAPRVSGSAGSSTATMSTSCAAETFSTPSCGHACWRIGASP